MDAQHIKDMTNELIGKTYLFGMIITALLGIVTMPLWANRLDYRGFADNQRVAYQGSVLLGIVLFWPFFAIAAVFWVFMGVCWVLQRPGAFLAKRYQKPVIDEEKLRELIDWDDEMRVKQSIGRTMR